MYNPITLIVSVLVAAQIFVAGLARSETIEVDVQLVLAADISGSMGNSLREAQRRGFVLAFRHRTVQRSIMSGPTGRIAVTYFEWAGENDQQLIVPWMLLATPEDMALFSAILESGRVRSGTGGTSISGAMRFAERLLQQSQFVSLRKVIDISGNGRHGTGASNALPLMRLLASGATVNGLVLPKLVSDLSDPYGALFFGYSGTLIDYYRAKVIGGPGAFAFEVDSNDDFAGAILRKLVMEIALAEPKGSAK